MPVDQGNTNRRGKDDILYPGLARKDNAGAKQIEHAADRER